MVPREVDGRNPRHQRGWPGTPTPFEPPREILKSMSLGRYRDPRGPVPPVATSPDPAGIQVVPLHHHWPSGLCPLHDRESELLASTAHHHFSRGPLRGITHHTGHAIPIGLWVRFSTRLVRRLRETRYSCERIYG